MTNFTKEHIEAVREFLAQEAETVELEIVDAEAIFFNIIQDELSYNVIANPFYDEDDNIKGFELEFKEEGQDFYKGSGTVFVD